MGGDVEKNQGPYNIVRIAQTSYSQGHEKFGVTREIQCTCISLYSVCFSSFKSIFEWSSEDLEHKRGSFMYRTVYIDIIVKCWFA